MKTRISLKVTAGARTTALAGRFGDAWKLHVAGPPVDGKANDAITKFFADLLSIPRSAVRIVSGLTSARKIVEIEDAPQEAVAALLDAEQRRVLLR